jgi:hypothetical protein
MENDVWHRRANPGRPETRVGILFYCQHEWSVVHIQLTHFPIFSQSFSRSFERLFAPWYERRVLDHIGRSRLSCTTNGESRSCLALRRDQD